VLCLRKLVQGRGRGDGLVATSGGAQLDNMDLLVSDAVKGGGDSPGVTKDEVGGWW
jgi:hypothetical protein